MSDIEHDGPNGFIDNFRRAVEAIPRPNSATIEGTADPRDYGKTVVHWFNVCPVFIEGLKLGMGSKVQVHWPDLSEKFHVVLDFDRYRGALLAWLSAFEWAVRPERQISAATDNEQVEKHDALDDLRLLLELFEVVLQSTPTFIPGGFDKHVMDWLGRCAKIIEGQAGSLGVNRRMAIPNESDSIGRFLGALQMWLYSTSLALEAKRESERRSD